MLLDEADSKDPAAIAQREFDIQWTANSLYVGKPRTAFPFAPFCRSPCPCFSLALYSRL